MIATIRDSETLESLQPSEVALYLHGHGWRYDRAFGPSGAVWLLDRDNNSNARSYEVLLPLRTDLDDYAYRLADILHVLETVEKRSQLELTRDIKDVLVDVIRMRFQGPAFDDGSVPLEAAENIVHQARAMMTAAACAVVQPRVVYGVELPPQVVGYMDGVRLGQTERGSFILTIRSLLPVRYLPTQQTFLEAYPGESLTQGADSEPPFERRVTLKLTEALQATLEATTASQWSAVLGARRGVSANMCQSLARLLPEGLANELSVSVNWSPAQMPPESNAQPMFRFPASAAAQLSSIAEGLQSFGDQDYDRILFPRESIVFASEKAIESSEPPKPRDNYSVEGPVIALASDKVGEAGTVTVRAIVDGREKNIKVRLEGGDYLNAVAAHFNAQLVSVTGTLSPRGKGGRVFYLLNPLEFTVISDE